jgi:signal peptidase I
MLLLSKFKILGHSMEPTIKNNGSVLVSQIPFLFIKPKVKDIIAFKMNNKILIKRIMEIDKNKFFLKGDNLKDSLDSSNFGFISKNDIVGKVIYKLK